MTTVDLFELPAVGERNATVGRIAPAAVAVLTGAAAMAASAKLTIPLPFTPVPITAQTLVVLLCGALLGRRLGPASIVTYLAAGAAGLPVFAKGGGLAYFLGPTGGYLVGFVGCALVVGLLVDRGWSRSRLLLIVALLIGDAVVFALGMTWLWMYFPAKALPLAGLVPFLPGEALKITIAAMVTSRLRR